MTDSAETAKLDQAFAVFRDEMATLTELARRLVAKVGAEQARADLLVYLIKHYGDGRPSVLAAIAATSLISQVTAG